MLSKTISVSAFQNLVMWPLVQPYLMGERLAAGRTDEGTGVVSARRTLTRRSFAGTPTLQGGLKNSAASQANGILISLLYRVQQESTTGAG